MRVKVAEIVAENRLSQHFILSTPSQFFFLGWLRLQWKCKFRFIQFLVLPSTQRGSLPWFLWSYARYCMMCNVPPDDYVYALQHEGVCVACVWIQTHINVSLKYYNILAKSFQLRVGLDAHTRTHTTKQRQATEEEWKRQRKSEEPLNEL